MTGTAVDIEWYVFELWLMSDLPKWNQSQSSCWWFFVHMHWWAVFECYFARFFFSHCHFEKKTVNAKPRVLPKSWPKIQPHLNLLIISSTKPTTTSFVFHNQILLVDCQTSPTKTDAGLKASSQVKEHEFNFCIFLELLSFWKVAKINE